MEIKIDAIHNELLCPHCGGAYMHHAQVDVYTRTEDAETTVHTCVGRSTTTVGTVPSKSTFNPSPRRGGLSVRFWCEICGKDSLLTIAQHKGNTLIDWELLHGSNT